ncbi:MAG TPA: adenylate/guanylate cyclase domain-containing protein, partial [Microvirga sp.]|nr:adenylate/guanylate cyclase domain-containing protein [Microvirga sp.]
MDIGVWLRSLGLERYEQAFRDNEIDAQILPRLTADDLKDIGVTIVGHRRKLLEAIAALGPSGEPGQLPPREPQTGPERHSPASHGQAERRQLTVMFVDLVGSTELSHRLDPEVMGELLRAYQNAVTGEVARFGGHVAKLMGDGVLCYFGWPRAREDAGECAVRAGLAVVAAVGRQAAPDGQPLAARVGIATGLVVVGDLIGEGAAREETVVGETPNLAARLQALAGPGEVVVGETTRRLIGGAFEFADAGAHELKGFPGITQVWRVVGERDVESRFEAAHAEALTS